MNTKHFAIFLATIALASCSKHDDGDLGHHHHNHTEEAPAEEHSQEIMLAPEMAEKFGVATSVVSPSKFHHVIEVSGQIADSPSSMSVVSAPTSGTVSFAPGMVPGKTVGKGSAIATISAKGISGGDSNAAARAALDAAAKELDRIKALYAKKLVTADAFNQAELAYKQAKAAYSQTAASGRATAVSSGVIGQLLVREGEYVEAGTPIATVSSASALTLRADVPERYYSILPSITSATVDAGGTLLTAARQGTSATATATRGYIPVYFTLQNNGSLAPGSFVTANLIGSPKNEVLVLPLAALSEQQGAYFVYERLDEECYRKLPVRIGQNDGANVEIISGIAPGQEIVTAGTVAVRLAESSSVVPEGHSHNH